jgi:hypothetical protein
MVEEHRGVLYRYIEWFQSSVGIFTPSYPQGFFGRFLAKFSGRPASEVTFDQQEHNSRYEPIMAWRFE